MYQAYLKGSLEEVVSKFVTLEDLKISHVLKIFILINK